ncbi:hypothetical protein VNI00_010861 [Paramarasmius palmivorus]|uniref:Uncharacterized protein n=1 Tax=Paramarasmius palmivorus TaxID=297713 RepID=A0AAW0CHR6_9AGAR
MPSNWSYQRLEADASNSPTVKPYNSDRQRTRRRAIIICGSITLLLIIIFGSLLAHPKTRKRAKDIYQESFREKLTPESNLRHVIEMGPPHYNSIHEYERNLPQHNLSLPFPEGKDGRYVWFANQIKLLGWNNCFNEVLMNAHLAYASNRAYVFQDYWWATEHYRWPKDKFLDDYPRTPLNAIIAGPTAGGLWEAEDTAPRSISEEWFKVVCPESERRIINTREVKPLVATAPGGEVFHAWQKKLSEAPEKCIEVRGAEEDSYSQTFDLILWGNITRLTSLWDIFIKSPTSRLLETSPLVRSAVDRNEYIFLPHGPRPPTSSPNPWDRLMAIHLRRGDYERHCAGLGYMNATWYGWNQLEFLPDKFEAGNGIEEHMRHCWPTIDDIVLKVREARSEFLRLRADGGTLDVMHLLTNDQTEFIDKLADALRREGWFTIRTTKDLLLDQEQTDVSMAVDMDIARKAAVFVGNGWSSFTSNIVHRRLKDGKDPISTRFF